jgi:hypothetical protein
MHGKTSTGTNRQVYAQKTNTGTEDKYRHRQTSIGAVREAQAHKNKYRFR